MKKHQEVLNRQHYILDQFKVMPAAYYSYLDEIMQPKYFAESEVLFRQGEIIDKAYFLSSGFMLANHYDENGDKHVINIFAQDEIISGKSFTEHTPSDYELVACKGAYVLYLTYDEVNTIYEKFPPTQEQAMIILADKEKKALDRSRMLNQVAEKKVADFYDRYPELKKQPGKIIIDADIASYLMISESSLRAHRANYK